MGEQQRVILLYRGDAIELPLGETVVGRDLECAFRIHDQSVSRRHLRFIRRRDEVFADDLSSTNGTLLNGRPIFKPIRLHDGDVLNIGNRRVQISFQEGGLPLDIEPSTLVVDERPKSSFAHEPTPTPKPSPDTSRMTSKLQAPATPAATPVDHRCSQCGAAVALADDECPSCGHRWGGFHPHSPTHVGPNLLRERQEQRHEVALPIVYRSESLEIEAETRDLSLSGVFVCTNILDTEGTKCTLVILIDGGPPIELKGKVARVVRSGTNGLGVAFEAMSDAARSWLESLIRQQE